MGTKSADQWRISDELWERIVPLLPPPPSHPLGCHRQRTEDRPAMNGIFFVLRTGCQWNALNATGICSSSTAHRRWQEWVDDGVFERLWAVCLEAYDEQVGIDWLWQALDGAMTKAPLGGGKNRSQSDRPGEAGGETQRAGRWQGRALGHRHRRGAPARLPVA